MSTRNVHVWKNSSNRRNKWSKNNWSKNSSSGTNSCTKHR
jgi:hypothetical protein